MNILQITDIAPNGECLTKHATIWLCLGKIVIGGIISGNANGFPSIDSARAYIAAHWPNMPVKLDASLRDIAA